jgi:hypothetical protein
MKACDEKTHFQFVTNYFIQYLDTVQSKYLMEWSCKAIRFDIYWVWLCEVRCGLILLGGLYLGRFGLNWLDFIRLDRFGLV